MTYKEHPNALILRQAWQAVSRSDAETLRELASEDIVWHVTSDNPWRGDHVGYDAVIDLLVQVGESGESYDTTLKAVLGGGDYAALVCHVSSKRGNNILEIDQVLLGRFEDGLIAEMWTLVCDPEPIARFWE